MTDRTTLQDCTSAAGSINDPTNPVVTPAVPVNPYVPPDFCVGTYQISQGDCAINENTYQDQLVASSLNISGAPLNVFKLLGIHEQTKLIDLTGRGNAIGSGDTSSAFDSGPGEWSTHEGGMAVLTTPVFIGYDFGIRLTSYGQPENAQGQPDAQHITSFRIQQGPIASTRALQVRVDRSDGNFKVNPLKITTGMDNVGNGGVSGFSAGPASTVGSFMLFATSPTKFAVAFTSVLGTSILGEATVGKVFNSAQGSFTINVGTLYFVEGDSFMVPVEMEWLRVDVVNLPNVPSPALIRIKQSAPARYWRLVPTSFAGATTDDPWVVEKLELFDFQATTLDDVQDSLFMENRDRDYAKSSIQLKVQYTPFDSVSDLSKFGFQMADIYSFTVSFAEMVRQLGRPIVIGDVLELPSEVQFDHHLRPVKKFLEVSDTGWAADGYTSGWKPVVFRFQAQQLIPSQEHRDILGTIDTQKYTTSDNQFFNGIEQISTGVLTANEKNLADARTAVPETGTNTREFASGTNIFQQPGSYDGNSPYIEDGLPPDGLPYDVGYKLPDVAGVLDGAYFRLEYDPQLNIAARLYKFSGVKNKWLWAESDKRRSTDKSQKRSTQEIYTGQTVSLTSKKI